MMEILMIVLFGWFFFGCLKLLFRMAWGATKVMVSLLVILAVPLLISCLAFAGGILLLIPVSMAALAFGILRAVI